MKLSLIMTIGVLFVGQMGLATSCYTNCKSRFPKWYQGPDRQRCNLEKHRACLKPSGLPGRTNLDNLLGKKEQLSERIHKRFLENGYVVSRKRDGSAMHHGDSVLWTNIAMASMSCKKGRPLMEAVTRSLHRNNGRLLRIDPLPSSYSKNVTSRDMETGLLYGFTMRSLKCPEDYAELKSAWAKHYSYVKKHGQLSKGSNTNYKISPALRVVFDLVSHHFGKGEKPSRNKMLLFETGVVSNSLYIKKTKEACYPLHLSALLMVTASKLDRSVRHFTRREYCADTKNMGLPLTDWYCDRGGWSTFLPNFKINHYEYRHQRCRYESPDVDPGENSPGVDFLILHSLASGS